MGQYHAIANLTRREGFKPKDVGFPLKMAELSSGIAAPIGALALALADEWAGDRVAVVGDYAGPSDLTADQCSLAGVDQPSDIYPLTDRESRNKQGWTNAGADMRNRLAEAGIMVTDVEEYNVVFRTETGEQITDHHVSYVPRALEGPSPLSPVAHIVNLDRRELISPTGLGDGPRLHEWVRQSNPGGTNTALALLLAAACKGGPRGGGDPTVAHDAIGAWAGDRIAVLDAGALGFADVTGWIREAITATQFGAFAVSDAGVSRASFAELVGV